MSNIYESPKSDVSKVELKPSIEPGIVLKILLVLFTILSCGLAFINQFIFSQWYLDIPCHIVERSQCITSQQRANYIHWAAKWKFF